MAAFQSLYAQTEHLDIFHGADAAFNIGKLRLEALDRPQLRSMADTLRQRLKSGVVVLATAADDKVSLIAALTPDLTKRLHAGKIAQAVAQRLGGTGGGRPDIAEAGGKNVNMLDSVINEVYEIVGAML